MGYHGQDYEIDRRWCRPGKLELLWGDQRVQMVLARCGEAGGWLFEILPDLFPHGRLTLIESELWVRHYKEKKERADKRKRRQ